MKLIFAKFARKNPRQTGSGQARAIEWFAPTHSSNQRAAWCAHTQSRANALPTISPVSTHAPAAAWSKDASGTRRTSLTPSRTRLASVLRRRQQNNRPAALRAPNRPAPGRTARASTQPANRNDIVLKDSGRFGACARPDSETFLMRCRVRSRVRTRLASATRGGAGAGARRAAAGFLLTAVIYTARRVRSGDEGYRRVPKASSTTLLQGRECYW